MQYRIFNLEDGIFGRAADGNSYFFAFLIGSFAFSFITWHLIEAPFANISRDLLHSKAEFETSSQFYWSQSAKAPMRQIGRRKSRTLDPQQITQEISAGDALLN